MQFSELRTHLSTLSLSMIVLVGCIEPKVEVKFRVQAKTNQGEPVSGAEIRLGREVVGKSGDGGQWLQNLELPAGEKLRLEISKRSEVNYYAPDFLDFTVADEGPQEVKYDATLYFVPKPSPKDDSKELDPSGIASNNSPTPAAQDGQPSGEGTALTDKGTEDVQSDDIPEEANAQAMAAAVGAPTEPSSPRIEPATTGDSKELKDAATPPPLDSGISNPPADVAATAKDSPADPGAAPGSGAAAAKEDLTFPQVELMAIGNIDDGSTNFGEIYPKPAPVEKPKLIFTVQVSDGRNPLAGVDIYLGREDKGDLKIGCQSNARGRCVIRFPDFPADTVKFIARKSGFITVSKSTRVSDKGILRLVLDKGETIDIFAVTRNYGFASGVKDVEVYADGKKLGATDSYGHFSYVYRGNHSDLLEVTLKNHLYLPEEYQSDFVVSGPMALTRLFSPKQAAPAKITFLRAQPAGKSTERELKSFNAEMDLAINRAARAHFYAATAFLEYPAANFESELRTSGLTLAELLAKGWQQSDLKGKVDAVVLPTLITGEKPALELTVIDSRGETIAAAKEDLDDLSDRTAIEHAIGNVAKKITQAFPFEGAILSKTGDNAVINIGKDSGRSLKVGDILDLFGNQSAKNGNKTENTRIATLTVTSVDEQTSQCKISDLAPRSTVERGDQVIVQRKPAATLTASEKNDFNIRVSAKIQNGKLTPITQANIYHNGQWLGSTGLSGRLYIDPKQFTGLGLLKVIKHGFDVYTKSVNFSEMRQLEVNLVQASAFLRIETVPSGASVTIDGKVIGKSPINQSAEVPAGFVKLEIDRVGGYKKYSQIMELDQGTLDLTGARAIKLEIDYRSEVAKLLEAGKIEDAVAKLEEVTEAHSDFLASRHQVGEIYLTKLNKPAKAAAAFAVVTSSPTIRDFNDKRFIGSHIDEGIAVFLTAETLVDQDKSAAIAHYQKAVEILERVRPYLRFVQKDQYQHAVHNVAFHRALAQHRIWQQTADDNKLVDVVKDWKDYVEGSAKESQIKDGESALLENAKVYYQQAKASLNSTKKQM